MASDPNAAQMHTIAAQALNLFLMEPVWLRLLTRDMVPLPGGMIGAS